MASKLLQINISVEFLMYIQIFVLAKTAFFLEGIQRSSLILKKPIKQSKTCFDQTNKKSGNYCN